MCLYGYSHRALHLLLQSSILQLEFIHIKSVYSSRVRIKDRHPPIVTADSKDTLITG